MNNQKPPLNFNFHGFVAARVFTNSPQVATFYASEYQYHQVESIDPEIPKVSLHFEYKPGWIPCPSGYIRQTHKALAHWVFRIEFFNDQIRIDACGNHFAIPMVHHMLLHPSLRYLSSQHGVLMLHAGAVAHSGSSLIFTGHGGAGKTTTTSLMLTSSGHEWDVHADDYVFLSSGPNSQAYITRSHLYRDLMILLPEIRSRLTRSERMRLEIFGRLRSWTNDRITWPVRLPVDRLWPGHQIAMSAVPAALLLLEKSDSSTLELIQVDPSEVPLSNLIGMNFREARHFLKLVRKNQSVTNFPSWFASWQDAEYNLLEKRTQEIPVYMLNRPKGVETLNTFRDSLMEKIVNLIP